MSSRELILGALAIVFLIVASTFIGLYAATKSHLNKDHQHHDHGDKPGHDNEVCELELCLLPRLPADRTGCLQHCGLRYCCCFPH